MADMKIPQPKVEVRDLILEVVRTLAALLEGKDLNMNAVAANIQDAHLSLGSILLKRWKFDDEFFNALTHHQDEELSPDAEKEILVVHLANMITRYIGFSLHNDKINLAALESALIL